MTLQVLETIRKQKLYVGSSVAIGMFRGVVVLTHGRASPNREDWVQACRVLLECHESARAQLVLTRGGVPNAAQRKTAIDQLPRGYVVPPVAVLADSAVVRGVITALNWFLSDTHRAFKEEDVVGIAKHLRVSNAEAEALITFAQELVPLH